MLLYTQGYRVGRFVSLERVIEQTKESYYDALYQASQSWHEGEHDITPWWSYLLSTIRQAYREFERDVSVLERERGGAKRARVEHAIAELPASFTAADVAAACPDISRELIRQVIRKYRDQGLLEASSRGRGARWRKVDPELDEPA